MCYINRKCYTQTWGENDARNVASRNHKRYWEDISQSTVLLDDTFIVYDGVATDNS